jgi:UDP-N-acetylglucosamine:LPS N-acetylglucosamine transferase
LIDSARKQRPKQNHFIFLVDPVTRTKNESESNLNMTPPSSIFFTAEAAKAGEAEPVSGGMKILFLSSDTGGGHRASAESLAKQFQLLYPGSTFILHDMVENEGTPPYSSLVGYYKHLSHHPTQWKIIYEVSNSRAFEMLSDAHLKLVCERAVRRRIMSIDPDVVISVHPLMCNVPVMSCRKIAQKTGKHIPMFTVVTDLGSAHCLWFANGVEKMFVGSEQIYKLAQARGKVPDEKLVISGLPIRHEFMVQADQLGDRMSPEGRAYQRTVREDLGLSHVTRKTVLVMGGGEGNGALSDIVDALYSEFVLNGIDALILVVCGRNAYLKKFLDRRDWDEVFEKNLIKKENNGTIYRTCGIKFSTQLGGCMEGTMTNSLRRILSTGSLPKGSPVATLPPPSKSERTSPVELVDSSSEEKKEPDEHVEIDGENSIIEVDTDVKPRSKGPVVFQFDGAVEEKPRGHVSVCALGFVTRMAEYMVASDVLVSKAGPGTISEAAALSLPVLLTSFLPGQEEGNIDFVINGGFGAYCSDRDPQGIAEELVLWLTDEKKMATLSKAAKEKGCPHAAQDIAKAIGDSTLKWKEINEAHGIAHLPVTRRSDSTASK